MTNTFQTFIQALKLCSYMSHSNDMDDLEGDDSVEHFWMMMMTISYIDTNIHWYILSCIDIDFRLGVGGEEAVFSPKRLTFGPNPVSITAATAATHHSLFTDSEGNVRGTLIWNRFQCESESRPNEVSELQAIYLSVSIDNEANVRGLLLCYYSHWDSKSQEDSKLVSKSWVTEEKSEIRIGMAEN